VDLSRSVSDLPYALAHHEELAARIEGKRLAVFLDFDGTLSPVAERPDAAVISESMRDIVSALSERCPVAIVSGRDRTDVHQRIGLDTLFYAGSHGFDIAGPADRPIRHQEGTAFNAEIEAVEGKLRRALKAVDGVLLEPKTASLSVHYRLVRPAERATVEGAVRRVLVDHPGLRLMFGKMIFEIQPRLNWNKGSAVLWLLRTLELDGPEVVPVYIGDDITDEDAFAVIKTRGIGFFVNARDETDPGRATAADYLVEGPAEVGLLLRFLVERPRQRSQALSP
jgi:trehalose-phosphatase